MAIYGGARPPCPVVPPCDTFGPPRVTGRVGVRAVVTLLGAIYREKSAVVTTAQRHNTFTKFSEMYKKAKNSPLLHLTIFIGIPLCRRDTPDEDAKNTPHMWEGQSADSHNNLLDFPTASAEKRGGGGGSLHEMQEMEVMMSGPLMMLTIVAAAVLALGAATWLIVGLCRAADVGDVDEGRAFGGEFEE